MERIVARINRQLEGNRLSTRSASDRRARPINTAALVLPAEQQMPPRHVPHMWNAGGRFICPCTRHAVISSFIMSFREADIKVTT